MIDFVASLPDTIVRSAVRSLDVKDQILDKVNLIGGVDDQDPRGCHLSQGQQKNRRRVNLQMTPFRVAHDCVAGRGVVFRMKAIVQSLSTLELLNLGGLAHHAKE